ncbi:MAG: hypothetical protein J6A88_03695 [Oscillospiraceae bacterium]|nr:hypothetical protein [Oscillospiraceae bacterium]
MHNIGDHVVYGINGVCLVLEKQSQLRNGQPVEYLVLEPTEQPGARYFVPTGNALAMSKLRPIMTKEELLALLSSDLLKQDVWIPDENQRKQAYRELINGGDRAALIQMICALQRHKQVQFEAGRKFHQSDENFLRDAQKLISAEFSQILGIPAQKVGEYILSAIPKE